MPSLVAREPLILSAHRVFAAEVEQVVELVELPRYHEEKEAHQKHHYEPRRRVWGPDVPVPDGAEVIPPGGRESSGKYRQRITGSIPSGRVSLRSTSNPPRI